MLDSQNIWSGPLSGMVRQLSPDEIGRADRARRIREYHEYDTQAAFAAWLGISPTRWNNYEKSGMRFGRDIVEKLLHCTPGLTGDWLERGDRRGLSRETDRRLHDAEAGLRGRSS